MSDHELDAEERNHRESHPVCFRKFAELTGKYETLFGAFPNNDPVGHRAAHQKMIDAAIAQEKFWTELKLELAKKGLIAIIVLLFGLVAAGFTVKVATALGIWKSGGG